MSTINLQRFICSALSIAQRSNCPQIVVFCPRNQFAIEALNEANEHLAIVIAWQNGTTKQIKEVCCV